MFKFMWNYCTWIAWSLICICLFKCLNEGEKMVRYFILLSNNFFFHNTSGN